MRFSPFNFQAPLAAGGVTLMAFNWLQFAVPHGEGAVKLSDIQWANLSVAQTGLYGALVGLMLVLTIANFALTAIFLRDLVSWIAVGDGYGEFMNGPPARVTGILVPVASLAMTMAVAFAVLPFFIPAVSANTYVLAVPGLIVFGFLWLTIFGLEFRLIRGLRERPLAAAELNFVWLLDVFAFGLVALAGTGLASMATSRVAASLAALALLPVMVAGCLLLVGKVVFLVYSQARSRRLPEYRLQPAFFLLVPITCLYGVSYYRIMLLGQKWFGLEVATPSQLLLSISYVAAAAWALFTVCLLSRYFTEYFRTSEYFPTQWSMV